TRRVVVVLMIEAHAKVQGHPAADLNLVLGKEPALANRRPRRVWRVVDGEAVRCLEVVPIKELDVSRRSRIPDGALRQLPVAVIAPTVAELEAVAGFEKLGLEVTQICGSFPHVAHEQRVR